MSRTWIARTASWTLAACVVALIISAPAATPALAKGPSAQPTGSEQCWVLPNPVWNGQKYVVYGSGFQPYKNVSVFISNGGIQMSTTDSGGNFSTWSWAQFTAPGTIGVSVYYQSDTRHRHPTTCSFQANGNP